MGDWIIKGYPGNYVKRKDLITDNSNIARMYSLPKIHKELIDYAILLADKKCHHNNFKTVHGLLQMYPPQFITKQINKRIFLTTLVESTWFRHQFHGRKSNFHALVKLYARPP